ncbi:hypothetical protein T484DRAFT_2304875 [Baffinella frigidus]|nr:hypothetical protein T484DRAFT_2304875 [Cryptophyta sp. CCMP2293]
MHSSHHPTPAPTTTSTARRQLAAPPPPPLYIKVGNWLDFDLTAFVSSIVEEGSRAVAHNAEALWNTSPREIKVVPPTTSSPGTPVARSILRVLRTRSAAPSASSQKHADTTSNSTAVARAALPGSSFVQSRTASSPSSSSSFLGGPASGNQGNSGRRSSCSSSGCRTPEEKQHVHFAPASSISYSPTSPPSSLRCPPPSPPSQAPPPRTVFFPGPPTPRRSSSSLQSDSSTLARPLPSLPPPPLSSSSRSFPPRSHSPLATRRRSSE